MANETLGMEEAARMLGVSVAKISGMVKRGEIRGERSPLNKRKVLIARSDIEELLRQNQQTLNRLR